MTMEIQLTVNSVDSGRNIGAFVGCLEDGIDERTAQTCFSGSAVDGAARAKLHQNGSAEKSMKGLKATEASSRGIALVTTLTILLVLTMLALSAVQGTSLQELLIRNTKDSNLAFNAAEAAVKEAERGIDALTAISYEPDAAFVIHDAITLGALDVSSDEVWATAASISTLEDGSSAIDTVATQPKYLVQHMEPS